MYKNDIMEAIKALENAQDDANMSDELYNEINKVILSLYEIVE